VTIRPVRATSRKGPLEENMPLDVEQIPPYIGYYLAGFADGEGSFNVSFRRRPDYKMPWKISLCFNVSNRDKVILNLFKKYIKCGTLRQRKDGVWYYEVNSLKAIVENVIPFFERFCFLSASKKDSFAKFKKIAEIIQEGRHTTEEGIQEILCLRKDMNRGGAGKRKYSDEEILKEFLRGESSETIRRASMEQ